MNKNVNNAYILNRVNQNSNATTTKNNQVNKQIPNASFEDVLSKIRKNEVVVSKHAMERLDSRSVSLNETEMKHISEALDKAALKGVKDAVIVMGNKLLIANVPNKTIITAAFKNDMKEQIITKIDGAIFI
jgi:flagellar operon protein